MPRSACYRAFAGALQGSLVGAFLLASPADGQGMALLGNSPKKPSQFLLFRQEPQTADREEALIPFLVLTSPPKVGPLPPADFVLLSYDAREEDAREEDASEANPREQGGPSRPNLGLAGARHLPGESLRLKIRPRSQVQWLGDSRGARPKQDEAVESQ